MPIHFHIGKIGSLSHCENCVSVQSLRVHQPYFLDPLLSPSSLRKITHRDSLPPMLQCISQIHLELDYLPEYTRRDPVMKRRREEVEEGGEEGKEGREGEKEGWMGGGREYKVCSLLFGTRTAEGPQTKGIFHLFFACLDHRRYPNTLLSILGYSGPVVVPWLCYGY